MRKLFLIMFFAGLGFTISAQVENSGDFYFIDTHNDVLSKQVLLHSDLAIDQPALNFDLPKAMAGELRGQVFSIFCDETVGKGKAFKHAMREIDSLMALIHRNPGKIRFVSDSRSLKKAIKQNRLAAMIGVEGGHMIEDQLTYLDSFINRGIKYLTLTWNNSTAWATSARDETVKKDSLLHVGLSPFGREVVKKLNEAGVMIDVSHVGESTFNDVMAITTKPVIASHSSAWAITPHRRNLKDDQLKAIAKNDGVAFVNFYSEFLDTGYIAKKDQFISRHRLDLDSLTKVLGDEYLATIQLFSLYPAESNAIRPPLDVLVRHIDYMVKLIGADHVGIGADFDGAESFPLQMNDVSNYPLLITALKNIGYSNKDIKKIAHGNFIRVLKANEKN